MGAVLANTTLADILDDEDASIEHLTIFGNVQDISDVPGSAHLIDEKELDKFNYTDIMRVLTKVPGVYVLEEDGYGLRPNIGMRGTGQNRSEKVTLMEDGVLAAPAPYAAPSAYYFPTVGRMVQIEVLKGTSSAMYGPRTTGGVINLLSRQIPDTSLVGMLDVSAGEDGYRKLHSFIGGSDEKIGAVFELFRYQADGFKTINQKIENTGFVKNDLLSKVRFNLGSDNQMNLLEFKLKYSDENSDETYMGLTDEDFKNNPYNRYSASKLDNMSTTHKQLQINHEIQLSSRASVGSKVYYNDFARNWYKVSKIGGLSLSSGGIDAISIFDKGLGGETISVDIKANNREYLSYGMQSNLTMEMEHHDLTVGVRYHEDEMDRFQWVDEFELDSSFNLNQSSAGIPGTDSNRIDSAEALAVFFHDEFELDNFVINAGLRYENISLTREDWGKTDPARLTVASFKSNDINVLLPSLAVTYSVSENVIVLAGVQKGFAPPTPGNANTENEESFNYEIGLRYGAGKLNTESVFFYSDYSNMHGNCTASQGCNLNNIGDQYNAGEVIVAGLEFEASYQINLVQISIPISFTYTYTDTEFQNQFSSVLDTWGDVEKGDELPYVPENQAQVNVSVEALNWMANATVRYVGDVRTVAGSGAINDESSIDSRVIVDLSAKYEMDDVHTITLNVENLLDKQYAATRVFGSIMAGKPRSISLGYRYDF